MEVESNIELDVQKDFEHYKDENIEMDKESESESHHSLTWMLSATVKKKENIKTKAQKFIKKIKSKNEDISNEPKIIRILDNVSGVVKPGQICAIMGASGAGKTTLLNVLNCRNAKNIKVDGTIKINGMQVTSQSIAIKSGYVQQTDIFIGTMTVKEHLSFTAHLKMGRNFTNKEKDDRVNEIIEQVNLVKAKDTRIGMGDQKKGISGGEKRRLAFACEILTHRSILFCDEPTSGLDAYMALELVNIMKQLANKGITIICTIHQPSTQIFEQFGTLCLLSEGRVAYFGPRKDAVGYFTSLGYQCPSTYNPSDFYIKTLAIMPLSREESLKRAKMVCDSYEQSRFYEILSEERVAIENSPIIDSNSDTKQKHKYNASWLSQIKWLTWRNFITDSRSLISKMLVLQTLFIAVFFGLIYLQIDNNEVGVGDRNGLMFLVLMNGGFLFLFPVLNVFCSEIPVFHREEKNNLYSTFIYFVTKQIAEFPKYFILNGIFITILYWMSGINNNFGVFVEIFLLFSLKSQCAIGFAYFISALTADIDVASAIAAPILVPLLLFAGYFLSSDSIPAYFVWVKYISWFYYIFDALMIVQWRSVDYIPCSRDNGQNQNIIDYNSTTLSSFTNSSEETCSFSKCYASGQDVLDQYSINKDDLAFYISMTIVLCIILRVLAYVALKINIKRK